MTYFAIRCEPGRLPVVRQLLRRAGQDAYLPAISKRIPRKSKKFGRRTTIPLMPYLFVKAPEHDELRALWMQKIKAHRYVKDFVVMDRMIGPHPIADVLVDRLRKAVKGWTQVEAARRTVRGFRKGDKARAKEGPFAGKKGVVTWSKGQRARWETVMFGRSVEVVMDAKHLEAA